MVAVDKALDAGWTLVGGDEALLSTPTLNADINWDNDQAYEAPGAPANGSDYVRFRDATDAYLDVAEVTSIEFNGASELPPLPFGGRSIAGRRGSGTGPPCTRARVTTSTGRSLAPFGWVMPAGSSSTPHGTPSRATTTPTSRSRTTAEGPGPQHPVHRTPSTGRSDPAFEGRSGGWVHETCNLRGTPGRTSSSRSATSPTAAWSSTGSGSTTSR